jgi:hypothetical protein
MTQVKFLYERDSNDVFACFPNIPHDNSGMLTCYAHIGQHSACHKDYAKECKEAPINEYWDLLEELISQGYNDLQIMNSHEIECHRPPTKGEVKFGEGAIHYRNFPLSVIGLKKGKGMWKDWFISPDDGLRYYTK